VDVGDLLHLEGALHGDRMVEPAADEVHVVVCCEVRSQLLGLLLVLEALIMKLMKDLRVDEEVMKLHHTSLE
jgi:hypothetical protein